MITPPVTEVVEILEPVKIDNDGLDVIEYRSKYTLMVNIKPISSKSSAYHEALLHGAEKYTPLYSVYCNLLLPDVTHEYRVRWRESVYDIVMIQTSTLGSVPSTSFVMRRIVNV